MSERGKGRWDARAVAEALGAEIIDPPEIARRLHRQGWIRLHIARALGVSPQTVSRWIDPERNARALAEARRWKAEHREHLRAYDARYLEGIKVPCRGCGQKCEPDTALCRSCREALRDVRDSVAIGCYEQGWTLAEIAKALDSTAKSTNARLCRLRRQGWPGRRYKVNANGRRIRSAA